MDRQDLLRNIPKVDDVLRWPQVAALTGGPGEQQVTEAVRRTLDELRAGILEGRIAALPGEQALCDAIRLAAEQAARPALRPVINATGIILHTNLGRASLCRSAIEAVEAVSSGYSNLEYDLDGGERGSRHAHVQQLLTGLTQAEAAMVVNNNAAAVLLTLSALCAGGEVVVSRGELVEIGGSFRIPEIMEQSGCTLREVGATNKTHLHDYERAVGEQTRALLKVHTSNYRIVGFTESVPLGELAALGARTGLPVIEDLGSGCLVDLGRYGLHGEPTVQQSIAAGADVVSFSGDKLLGGPQAGIIVGKKAAVDKLKKHPLARAVRVDKMTLAALEATLRCYLDTGRAEREIPTLRMLSLGADELRERAGRLCALLAEAGADAQLQEDTSFVGGGSVPTQTLPTFVAAVSPMGCGVDALDERLRQADPPIVGRIAKNRYLLDARTLSEADFPYVAKTVAEAAR